VLCRYVSVSGVIGIVAEVAIIHFQLKVCMPVKIAGCFVTGSYIYQQFPCFNLTPDKTLLPNPQAS
jgi:hypothetical protein